MKYLFILVLLTGCGSDHEMTVDDRLLLDVKEFVSYMKYYKVGSMSNIKNISVKSKESFEEDIIGVCVQKTRETIQGRRTTKNVYVSDELLGTCNQRVTLFHELGHCALGLDHDDRYLKIMNTYDFDCTNMNWPALVRDMFEDAGARTHVRTK